MKYQAITIAMLTILGGLATAPFSFACEDEADLKIEFKGKDAYYIVCDGKAIGRSDKRRGQCVLERVKIECDSCPKGTTPHETSSYCVKAQYKLGIGSGNAPKGEKPTMKWEESSKAFPTLDSCLKAVKGIAQSIRKALMNDTEPTTYTKDHGPDGDVVQIFSWDLADGRTSTLSGLCMPKQ